MIRFGDFRLLPAERQLWRGEQPLELGARAFDLLHTLVQHAGRLIGKSELLDRVWPDVIVEEGNLHVQMTALRKAIGRDAIATVPGRGYQFVLPIETGPALARRPDAPGAEPLPRPVNAPSALPALLGRDAELARVLHALTHAPAGDFVTLSGAGGSGKTLLARHVAARLEALSAPVSAVGGPSLPAWVDLVELAAPSAVVPAVAAAAGMPTPPRDAQGLARALADTPMWLVLDNAEHLLEAVGDVVDALRRDAPGVRVLVTSQAPLRRAGEQVQTLAGLSVPRAACTPDEALGHAAVALFVAQARQADRRFRFGAEQVADVVAVCASLAGSALGVQLAAALLGQMSLAALRERLARQDTGPDAAAVESSANVLRSALSWSHDLLAPASRRAFRRLAVAQGPLPLELARAVVAAGSGPGEDGIDSADAVDDAIADLVDRSLLQCETHADRDGEGITRYRLLEAPRALALEQLHAAGEARPALLALARALAPLGDIVHKKERDGELDAGLEARLRQQTAGGADCLAAFEAALAGPELEDAAVAIRCANLSWPAAQGRPIQGRLRWAAALGSLGAKPALPAELRARALDGAATLVRHSNLALRGGYLEAAAGAWREAGDVFGEFRSLARASDSAALSQRHEQASALLERVRALEDPAWTAGRRRWRWFAEGVAAVSAGDLPRAKQAWRKQLELVQQQPNERIQAMHSLANAEQIDGRNEVALPLLLESVALSRQLRNRNTRISFLLPNLVAAQVALGDLAGARKSADEGWPFARQFDAEAWWADHLALLALGEGRPRTAARLLGLADAGYARLNDGRQALEAQALASAEPALRTALGDPVFEALRAEGRDPSAADALTREALAAEDGPAPR